MNFTLECEQEDDGRWLAEVLELPGALAYGTSQDDALGKAEILALRVIAERLEHGEVRPLAITISLPAAHERMAVGQGAAGAFGFDQDRLGRQTPDGVAQDLVALILERFRVRLP